MRRPIFLLSSSLSMSLLCSVPCAAQSTSNRQAFDCVGSWGGAAPVTVEIVDGKVFQNGEEMQDVSVGPQKITYNKRDGADLFTTTITPATGRLTISVFQSPRKEEQAFLEGKCKVKP
jgi:hypothetical protein